MYLAGGLPHKYIPMPKLTNNNSGINYAASKSAFMILRSIDQKLRQGILGLLEENTRLNVTDIYVKMRMEQSVASQHLAILRHAGIVRTEREGKTIYYTLNRERIAEVVKFVNDITTTM